MHAEYARGISPGTPARRRHTRSQRFITVEKNDADRIDRAKKIVPKMARFAPFSERRRRKFCQNNHENGEILRSTTSSRPYERRSSAFGHVIFLLAAAQITHLLSCRPPNQCWAGNVLSRFGIIDRHARTLHRGTGGSVSLLAFNETETLL